MKLKSLDDLLVSHLRDLYRAEARLGKSLPKMAKAASSAEVKSSLKNRASEKKTHRQRLEKVFEQLGRKPEGGNAKAMKALLQEGFDLLESKGEPAVIDSGLIAVLQAAEHYRIAAYGCVQAWAQETGHSDSAELLQLTLDENKESDHSLSRLAELVLNPRADDPSAAKKAAAKAAATAKLARAAIASTTEKVKQVTNDNGDGESPAEASDARDDVPALSAEVPGDSLSPVAPSP